MAYDSRVYRVLRASPSDVEEERDIVVRAIQEWNDLYSYSRKVALLPLWWETHTAPEYGSRPQEVINRAIVDECDLLVGIFWTRIGSPTGLADSGTLEEIERVATAGKPIMLYFSRREIDPEKIDLIQIDQLKKFKIKIQPQSLVENYSTIIDFHDKFSKQLEMKVRDLQRGDTEGDIPLSLKVLSNETGDPEGTAVDRLLQYPTISKLDNFAPGKEKELKELIDRRINELFYTPVALGIYNDSASSVRNMYVEISIFFKNKNVKLTNSLPGGGWFGSSKFTLVSRLFDEGESEIREKVRQAFAKYEDNLQRDAGAGGWRLSFEWDALQPQRLRLIKPILYISSTSSAQVDIKAKIYSDFSPEPFKLEAHVRLKSEAIETDLPTLMPDWQQRLEPPEGQRPRRRTGTVSVAQN